MVSVEDEFYNTLSVSASTFNFQSSEMIDIQLKDPTEIILQDQTSLPQSNDRSAQQHAPGLINEQQQVLNNPNLTIRNSSLAEDHLNVLSSTPAKTHFNQNNLPVLSQSPIKSNIDSNSGTNTTKKVDSASSSNKTATEEKKNVSNLARHIESGSTENSY